MLNLLDLSVVNYFFLSSCDFFIPRVMIFLNLQTPPSWPVAS